MLHEEGHFHQLPHRLVPVLSWNDTGISAARSQSCVRYCGRHSRHCHHLPLPCCVYAEAAEQPEEVRDAEEILRSRRSVLCCTQPAPCEKAADEEQRMHLCPLHFCLFPYLRIHHGPCVAGNGNHL